VASRKKRFVVWPWILGWIILLALAFRVDSRVAHSIAAHPPFHKAGLLASIVKWPGNFWFTLIIAALLWFFHRDGRYAAVRLILAAAIGGLIYTLTKWIAGRPRPVPRITPFAFHPFIHGLPGLWNANDLGFPSGHACLSFATAACLAMALPRWRILFFALATIVGLERIGENAHYVSDVIAGAGFGVLSALLADWLLNQRTKSRIPP
jgi:membrane-associated phospholipid phosphatase